MTHAHASRWYLAVVTGILLCTLPSMAAAEQGPDHPDQQRRGQRPHHRSRDQQGRRRDQGDRSEPRGGGRAGRQPHLHQRRSARARSMSSTRRRSRSPADIPLSGHPNNIAVGRDGRRVYVGIIQAPGGVDVIDTASLKNVKTLPDQGQHPQRRTSRRTASTSSPARSRERRSTCSTPRRKSPRGRSTWIWASVR